MLVLMLLFINILLDMELIIVYTLLSWSLNILRLELNLINSLNVLTGTLKLIKYLNMLSLILKDLFIEI